MTQEIKTKAFIYLRRSQDREDRQVLSIDGQKAEIAKVIQQHNISPIWLTPEDQSARKIGRPVFKDMMKRIYNDEAKTIICWNANRLSRNAKDSGDLIYAMDEQKLLSVITPSRVYRNNKEDKFMLNIEFGTSKLYSDEISANVLRGYQAKYERGEYPTHAPIGYVNVQIGHHRNIAPDPERKLKIIKLFELAGSGKYTLDSLHKHATEALQLTNKNNNPVAKQTLYDLLHKSLYYGVFEHGGETHIGSYEPLITQDVYDKAQVGMGWKSKRNRNTASGEAYPYKGIFTCKKCGHNLTAYTKSKQLASGSAKHYTYYVCTRKSKSVACKEPQITDGQLEAEIEENLNNIQITPEIAEECVKLIRHLHGEMIENRNTMLSTWKQRQKEIEQKLNILLEMRISREITQDEFKNEKNKLNNRLVRTKELIDDTHSNADTWLELAENYFSTAISLTTAFNSAEDEDKRKLLLELGSNWQLSNKKALFTPREPYGLLVNKTNSSNWRARPDSNRRSPP
jgi:site-specific DNA recombinase